MLSLTLVEPIGRSHLFFQLEATLKDGTTGSHGSVLGCDSRGRACAINTRLLPRGASNADVEFWGTGFAPGNVREITVQIHESVDGDKTRRDVSRTVFTDL
jgi:hypothetical protein